MSFARRFKIGTLLFLGAVVLAMGWITTALAQVTGSDGDGPDGDEFSGIALVLVAAIAVGGWVVYKRRSTRAR
ncbi:MAG: hypothetical protein LC797_23350 [Chloroflexi bacterium]|nr:hypothetical protein [Chloroflexota bacterium]